MPRTQNLATDDMFKDEVRRLLMQLDTARKQAAEFQQMFHLAVRDRDEVTAERDALRARACVYCDKAQGQRHEDDCPIGLHLLGLEQERDALRARVAELEQKYAAWPITSEEEAWARQVMAAEGRTD
jgi:hypothetical protein